MGNFFLYIFPYLTKVLQCNWLSEKVVIKNGLMIQYKYSTVVWMESLYQLLLECELGCLFNLFVLCLSLLICQMN